MIVSASFRTDIPAFYAEWFAKRFQAGFARVVNPYGGPHSRVDLRDGVDGFVFWTRNAEPFRDNLDRVRAAGLPFVVTWTVTGYPKALEPSVIAVDRAVDGMRRLAGEFGPRSLVWRYDPVVFTSLTDAAFHAETFDRLAAALEGVVDECQISVATIYKKSARNLDVAARAHRFAWWDPDDDAKRAVIAQLAERARAHGMRLGVCSQATLTVPGTRPAVCIDARRLEDVAAGWGRPTLIPARVKGNRPDCACFESRDIGAYDTCPHGCAYCYAVSSRGQAKRRFQEHDPDSEFLAGST